MRVIRGATTVKHNKVADIKYATIELFDKIIANNNLDYEQIFYIDFICTKDLNQANPATILRHANDAIKNIPLMCHAHHEYKGALKKCIRISLFTNQNIVPMPIYLNDAVKLREDMRHG